MKSNINKRNNRCYIKKILTIVTVLLFVFCLMGPPPFWPRRIGKKLPEQPPINKPLPSATVIYSNIINVEE